ncbi:retrovirus-related pol polyprotein from transposon TNT 1-94 [Tanacetum coccineum]
MRQRFSNPLALLANTYNPPPSYNSQKIQYHTQTSEVYQPYQHYQSNTPITQQLIQSPPLQNYAPIIVHQPPTLEPDTGFAVLTFVPTDDPIASLNKAMIFLISRLCGQCWKESSFSSKSYQYNWKCRGKSTKGNQCYNYNGEGHIAKQCTAKKRVKDSEWFKDKMLFAQAQEAGVVLNDEQDDFLADSLEEINDCEDLQLQATINFKADHIDAYDLDYDDEATANAIFMENLSLVGFINDDTVEPCYDYNILSEISYYDTYHDIDMLNLSELEYIEK